MCLEFRRKRPGERAEISVSISISSLTLTRGLTVRPDGSELSTSAADVREDISASVLC